MNIALWVLQIILGAHTAIGAVWKFSNPAQSIPSLAAIPNGAWIAMAGVELLCAIGFIVPVFYKPLAFLVPISALVIAMEMLLFIGLHLASGHEQHGSIIYWLVVATICALIAYFRLMIIPR